MADMLANLTLANGGSPQGDFWLPPDFSTFANEVDGPFMFITWVCIACFVGIVALMLWFMWRYSRARGVMADHRAATHHTVLEVTWSGIPLIIVILMFYVGFRNYMHLATPPADAYQIEVTGQQWRWLFRYPNGWETTELHVPADEPVRLLMKSKDVLHAFFIPDFRAKQDVVPGKFSSLWFQAIYDPSIEEVGPQDVPANPHWYFCAEFCGTEHSDMVGIMYVHRDRASFEEWLEKDSDPYGTNMMPHEIGNLFFQIRGCDSCHRIDGTPYLGPSLKNTWREVSSGQRRFASGPPLDTSDPNFVENYISESLTSPNARIHSDFPKGGMPTFRGQLDDQDISAIIAYIKWLAENDGHPYDEWKAAQAAEGE